MANNKIVKDLTNGRLLFYCNNVLSATCNRTGWHNGSDIDGSGACKGFKIDFDRNNGWFIFNIIEINDTQTTCGYISKFGENTVNTVLYPVKDIQISQYYPDTNFGTNVDIEVNSNKEDGLSRHGLIKFDFSGLPVGIVTMFNYAKLKLYAHGLSVWGADPILQYIDFYRMLTDWEEFQATWNKKNITDAWQIAGCLGVNDYNNTLIGRFTSIIDVAWNEVTLDANSIIEILEGTFINNGFFIKYNQEDIPNYNKVFFYTMLTAFSPELHINYTAEGTSWCGFKSALPPSTTASTAEIDSDETANHIQFKIDGATVGFIDAIGTHDGASY